MIIHKSDRELELKSLKMMKSWIKELDTIVLEGFLRSGVKNR